MRPSLEFKFLSILKKIRNHWNDSYLTYDDGVDSTKPRVFSADLNRKYYQEWIILPGLDKITVTLGRSKLPGPECFLSGKDVDAKMRHSGRFYIKLKVDEGSRLGDLFLSNNSGNFYLSIFYFYYKNDQKTQKYLKSRRFPKTTNQMRLNYGHLRIIKYVVS